jgi:hypothetical protein
MFYASIVAISLIFAAFEWRGLPEKTSRLLFYLNAGLLFILVAFNRMSADYPRYERDFLINERDMEPGFLALFDLMRTFDLPFATVRFLMAALMILVLLAAAKITASNLTIFYYLLYPLVLDLPQIRNTLMYLIVLLVFLTLGQRSRLAVFAGVLLGGAFHIFGLIYAPLALLLKCSRQRFFLWLKIFAIALTATAITLQILNQTIELPKFLYKEISPFLWFYFMIQVLHAAIDLFTYWWLDRKLAGRLDAREQPFYETLYRFGWFSALYLPLSIASSEIYRFRRNAQLVKYIYSAGALRHLEPKDRAITVGLILLNLAFVIAMLYHTEDLHNYLYFERNVIVSWFTR